MAKYRKLSRTSDQRKALLRGQVTQLIANGKIVTTEAKAKEVRKIAESLIALAIKEKDNFEEKDVTVKVPRVDKDGKRVKQIVDKDGKALAESHRDKDGKLVKIEGGKTVTVYDEVQQKKKIDLPSKLHARRQMMKVLYSYTEKGAKKSETKEINLCNKLFDEIAPKYANRNGGYTRIVKIGQRKGDGALEVLLELV